MLVSTAIRVTEIIDMGGNDELTIIYQLEIQKRLNLSLIEEEQKLKAEVQTLVKESRRLINRLQGLGIGSYDTKN